MKEIEMLGPFSGMGNKNKAEGLYLLKRHEPYLRIVERFDRYEDDADRSIGPMYPSYLEEQFGRGGEKVTAEAAIAFLGPPLLNEHLPDWLRQALRAEEGDPEMAKIKAVYDDMAKLKGLYGSMILELACDPYTPPVEVKTMVVIHGYCTKKNLRAVSDNTRPSATASVGKLARRVGVSRQYLFSVLDSLEEQGAIDIIRRNRRSGIIYINRELMLILNPKKIQAEGQTN